MKMHSSTKIVDEADKLYIRPSGHGTGHWRNQKPGQDIVIGPAGGAAVQRVRVQREANSLAPALMKLPVSPKTVAAGDPRLTPDH